jgi:hypothetical protein
MNEVDEINRLFIAAQAMQGMLANDDWHWDPSKTHESAEIAVRFADALIAAAAKESGE